MKGSVFLITGAGTGIGAAVARYAATLGSRVVVNNRKSAHGSDPETVALEIRAAGGSAEAYIGDVSTWKDALSMCQFAREKYGRLDGVVNCAAILADKTFHKMTVEEWKTVIDVNLTGTFLVSRAAAEIFREQQSGSMVHFTSNAGLIGNRGQANYAASKLGIVALSRSIALDMAKFNVTSNVVSPSALSRMTKALPMPEARGDWYEKMPPEKIAPLVAYLLSKEGRSISGQVFYVRCNEIMSMSQSRPLRTVHRSEGWTLDSIHATAMPALRPSFYGLETAIDYFDWDPI